MKLTTAIATVLPLIQTSEAIYLACCQTTKECPQYYNTIETFAEGKDTINACCYPDEEARTEDLPECVHPIMTEDGVGISVMSLPSLKLEGSNETAPHLMEEITITEGNEQISIAVTSLEEASTNHEATSTEDKNEEVSIEHTSLKPSSTEELTNETSQTTEKSETTAHNCCAVASTTPALRVTKDPVCPNNMHHVEGVTINLSLLDAPKTLVCCDSKVHASDVDTSSVSLCSAVTSTEEEDGEDKNETEETKDEQDSNGANALKAEDGSNSASGFGSASFSIAALCAVVQALL